MRVFVSLALLERRLEDSQGQPVVLGLALLRVAERGEHAVNRWFSALVDDVADGLVRAGGCFAAPCGWLGDLQLCSPFGAGQRVGHRGGGALGGGCQRFGDRFGPRPEDGQLVGLQGGSGWRRGS